MQKAAKRMCKEKDIRRKRMGGDWVGWMTGQWRTCEREYLYISGDMSYTANSFLV